VSASLNICVSELAAITLQQIKMGAVHAVYDIYAVHAVYAVHADNLLKSIARRAMPKYKQNWSTILESDQGAPLPLNYELNLV
jgi:hypothetical protein